MSEATLTKIQAETAKMEAELATYKNALPMTAACQALIQSITSHPEPFVSRNDPNPWVAAGGGGGGCSIS